MPRPLFTTWPAGHLHDGLDDDRRAHLRSPALALDERDGHLDDGQAVLHRVPQHVDLEAVPARVHLLEVQRAERVGAEHPVPGGRIPHWQREHPAGVGAAGLREPHAPARPVHHGAARHPARPDHDVGGPPRGIRRLEAVEHRGKLLGQVRAVGVELHHGIVAALERPVEGREVRRAEPFLAAPMQHLHRRIDAGEPVGEPARAVGRVVVDHEHGRVWQLVQNLVDEARNVFNLVERGERDQRSWRADR